MRNKTTKARIVFLALLICNFSLLQAFDLKETKVSTDFGYEQEYVSYGWKFTDAVVIPKIYFENGPWYLGIDAYLPVEKKSKNFNEWDYYAARNFSISEKLSVDVGGTVYNYPGGFPGTTGENETTFEPYLIFYYDEFLNPSFRMFYDLQFGSWIYQARVDHTFDLVENLSLKVDVRAGARDSNALPVWWHYEVRSDFIYSVRDDLSVSAGLRTTDNSDHVAAGHDDMIWWGANCSFQF